MNKSKIQWTESTWNPVTGCTKISSGCKNCYAEVMTRRLKAMGQEKYKEGFDKVVCHPESLEEPFKWEKGRMIFVNSMSDLFHENVPYDFVNKVFNVIRLNPQHTFQILTKRASRIFIDAPRGFYPDNLWMGVTVENQEQANERIPYLLRTGAKVKFVSVEPMLGPIDFYEVWCGNQLYHTLKGFGDISGSLGHPTGEKIDWVICGGETGPKARPMNPNWVRSLRDQCQDAEVPFFFKQWGAWCPSGTKENYSFLVKGQEVLFVDEVMSRKPISKNIDWLDGERFNQWPEISTSANQLINTSLS